MLLAAALGRRGSWGGGEGFPSWPMDAAPSVRTELDAVLTASADSVIGSQYSGVRLARLARHFFIAVLPTEF